LENMNKFDGEHEIQKAGFKIEKTYRIFENPYHRFFILRKGE